MAFNPSIELWIKRKVSEWGWKLVATQDSEGDGERTPLLSSLIFDSSVASHDPTLNVIRESCV